MTYFSILAITLTLFSYLNENVFGYYQWNKCCTFSPYTIHPAAMHIQALHACKSPILEYVWYDISLSTWQTYTVTILSIQMMHTNRSLHTHTHAHTHTHTQHSTSNTSISHDSSDSCVGRVTSGMRWWLLLVVKPVAVVTCSGSGWLVVTVLVVVYGWSAQTTPGNVTLGYGLYRRYIS